LHTIRAEEPQHPTRANAVPSTLAVSIGVISRGPNPKLRRLLERLSSVAAKECCEVLAVVENANAREPTVQARAGRTTRVEIPAGRGLAYNRNQVLRFSGGDIIVFIDDDCFPEDGWLGELVAPFEREEVEAVMGRAEVPPSTFLGDSIAALGFPAGGSLGYEKMYGVDDEGFTGSIITLNCAVRARVFKELGPFNGAMTKGAEDMELAWRMQQAGKKILYQSSAVVEHEARSSLRDFARWFFSAGRGKYQLAENLGGELGPLVRMRLRSYGSILWAFKFDPKIVAIAPLLVASNILQLAGFVCEARRRRSLGLAFQLRPLFSALPSRPKMRAIGSRIGKYAPHVLRRNKKGPSPR